jgi:hypothetical protein
MLVSMCIRHYPLPPLSPSFPDSTCQLHVTLSRVQGNVVYTGSYPDPALGGGVFLSDSGSDNTFTSCVFQGNSAVGDATRCHQGGGGGQHTGNFVLACLMRCFSLSIPSSLPPFFVASAVPCLLGAASLWAREQAEGHFPASSVELDSATARSWTTPLWQVLNSSLPHLPSPLW